MFSSRGLPILGGNGIAAYLDFGVGALIVAIVSIYFERDIPLYYLFIGGWFALLPDFDLLPSIIRGKSADFNHHETLLHRPIVLLPIASYVAYYFGGPFWGTVVCISVLWHYLHDTKWFGNEGGIAWFWPLSRKYWSLFGPGEPSAGMPHHEWLKAYWLKPTKLSLTEITLGSIFLFLAIYILSDSIAPSLISVVIILIGIIFVWVYAARSHSTY